MSTYPQDLSTDKRRTSGLSTRKNDSIRASSFPPRKKSVPGFPSVHTHTNVNKKTKQKKQKKQNKTKTKRQNNKTKINNKNRKQNKKNDNE